MEGKGPDWRVYLDYYKRKARGENPQHVYDGYKGDQSEPESPAGSFVSNKQVVGEKAKAELENQKGGKTTAENEPKRKAVKQEATDKKTPKRKKDQET